MKISETILSIVEKAGGQISFTQFNEWIGLLIKSGHLHITLVGPEEHRTPYYQLTEKGNTTLHRLETDGQ